MATKPQILDALEAAGVEGFTQSNTKPELEAAAAGHGVDVAAFLEAAATSTHPGRARYDNPSNRAQKTGRLT